MSYIFVYVKAIQRLSNSETEFKKALLVSKRAVLHQSVKKL